MDELALEAKNKMEKSIISLRENFNTLRTGRANSTLLDRIQCEYYGSTIPINQICSVTSPDPRQLLVKPYDKNDLKAVYSAIASSDQNLNPTINSDMIRITIPSLTEDKRKELAKKAKTFADECKIAIRNIRRDYMDFLKESDEYSEDLEKRISDDIEKVTTEVLKQVDEEYEIKEKDILSI